MAQLRAWTGPLRACQLAARTHPAGEKHYEAALIEFRRQPEIEPLVLNAILKLPGWKHTVVCGPDNAEMVRSFGIRGLNVVELETSPKSVAEYSELLRTRRDVWEQLTGERVLLHQTDSFIFAPPAVEALEYDYCGPPWPRRYALSPGGVGNGGISIRNPRAMLEALGARAVDSLPRLDAVAADVRRSWPRGPAALQAVPEDVWFANAIAPDRVAPLEVAARFGTDSYEPNGGEWACGHKWWECVGVTQRELFPRLALVGSYWRRCAVDHVNGWAWAIEEARTAPHSALGKDDDGACLAFVSSIDDIARESRVLDGRRWIGVLHGPRTPPGLGGDATLPFYFDHPGHALSSLSLRQAMHRCAGIIALAADQRGQVREWLARRGLGHVPVMAVHHPKVAVPATLIARPLVATATTPIAIIGQQARRAADVLSLDTERQLVWLVADAARAGRLLRQAAIELGGPPARSPTFVTVAAEDYGAALHSHIVVLPLWAATANNAVLELIAYGVPGFVSRLPATEEYLGADYPMLYDDPGEIQELISDTPRLQAVMDTAREHLRTMDRSHIGIKRFTDGVAACVLSMTACATARREPRPPFAH